MSRRELMLSNLENGPQQGIQVSEVVQSGSRKKNSSVFYVVEGVGKYSVSHKDWSKKKVLMDGEKELGKSIRFCNRYLEKVGDKSNLNFLVEFSKKEGISNQIMDSQPVMEVGDVKGNENYESIEEKKEVFDIGESDGEEEKKWEEEAHGETQEGMIKNDFFKNLVDNIKEGKTEEIGKTEPQKEEVDNFQNGNNDPRNPPRRPIFDNLKPFSQSKFDDQFIQPKPKNNDSKKNPFRFQDTFGTQNQNFHNQPEDLKSSPKFITVGNKDKGEFQYQQTKPKNQYQDYLSSQERDNSGTYDCNNYFQQLIRDKFKGKPKEKKQRNLRSKIGERFNLVGMEKPYDVKKYEIEDNEQNEFVSLIKKHQREKRKQESVGREEKNIYDKIKGKHKRIKSRGFKPFKTGRSRSKKKTKIVHIDLEDLSKYSNNKRKNSYRNRKLKNYASKPNREFVTANTQRSHRNLVRPKSKQDFSPRGQRKKSKNFKEGKSKLRVIKHDGSFLDQFIKPGFADKKYHYSRKNMSGNLKEFSPLRSPMRSPYGRKKGRRDHKSKKGFQKKSSSKVFIDVNMLSKKTLSRMKRTFN